MIYFENFAWSKSSGKESTKDENIICRMKNVRS